MCYDFRVLRLRITQRQKIAGCGNNAYDPIHHFEHSETEKRESEYKAQYVNTCNETNIKIDLSNMRGNEQATNGRKG